MVKRILVLVVLVVVVLLGICVIRTLLLRAPKVAHAPAVLLKVDENGALQRFAGAIRIQTISEPLTPPNQAAMLAFRNYLETSFPHIHAAAKREVVGDGSLLFTWTGSDATLAPILLIGHMDVFPVDTTSLGRWKHPPFSGEMADGYI